MGYTTDFQGEFSVTPTLKKEHKAYLEQFAATRRMIRDSEKVGKMDDPIRTAVDLPVGDEGAYFVGGQGFAEQEHDASIINFNSPGGGQPGVRCRWVPTEDGTGIEWDGSEKFYYHYYCYYAEWLEYIIKNFLKRWGYVVSGRVQWSGESVDAAGWIEVTDNVVTTTELSDIEEPLQQAHERISLLEKTVLDLAEHYDWERDPKGVLTEVQKKEIRLLTEDRAFDEREEDSE